MAKEPQHSNPVPDFEFWHVYSYAIRKSPRLALEAFILFAISGAFQSAAVLVMAPLLNVLLGERTSGFIGKWVTFLEGQGYLPHSIVVGGVLVFIVLGWISSFLKYRAELKSCDLRLKVESKLREEITDRIFHVKWDAYLSLKSGNTLNALFQDAWRYSLGTDCVLHALGHLAVAAALIGMATLVLPLQSFLILGMGSAFALSYWSWNSRNPMKKDYQSEIASIHGQLVSTVLSQIKYIRCSGASSYLKNELSTSFGELHKSAKEMGRRVWRTHSLTEAQVITVIGIGIYFTFIGRDDSMVLPLVVLGLFYKSVPNLLSAQRYHGLAIEMEWSGKSWLKLNRTLERDADRITGHQTPSFSSKIEFTNVSYQYRTQKGEYLALDNVSFELEKGKCLVLLGPSGSGKSTTLDLFTGLLQPQRGKVLVDGVALSEINLDQWRKRIGFLPQNIILNSGTLYENIILDDLNANKEKAKKCSELAHLNNYLTKLPQGLETVIGDGGNTLSGGEKQRVAIARALYREPWLLLLDEPTSALDPENEAQIISTLKDLKGLYTIVIITHKNSFTEIADEVIHLDHGKIKEHRTFGMPKLDWSPT